MRSVSPWLVNRWCLLFVCGLVAAGSIRAQNPELGPSDLAYSKLYADKHRLIAQVSFQTVLKEPTRYRYERCPGVARITGGDNTEYGQVDGKEWLRSTDWGQTGTPVQDAMAGQLDTYAEMAEIPWAKSTDQDQSQGEHVWKLKKQSKEDGTEHFTYELTREKPLSDGSYPLFTFAKRKNDTEGRLLLEEFTGSVRFDTGPVPVDIHFAYTAPVAGDAKLSSYEVWITGEIFTRNNTLMFRTDKAVQGNTTGRMVLLGTNKTTAKVLLPLYARAAEKHAKLRLYGVLEPVAGQPAKGSPSVQFITWKMHAPSDPDELPEDKKFYIREGDELKGNTIEPKVP